MIGRVRRAVGVRARRLRDRAVGSLVGVKTEEHVCALTFDDGPHAEHTPALLDLLGEAGARATFFMIGERAAARPGLVERVASEGHAIGNHTWSHRTLPSLSPGELRRELRDCQRALAPWGRRMFRPPRGLQTPLAFTTLRASGYGVVCWQLAAVDWLDHDEGYLADRMLSHIRPGTIVLLHDAIWDPRVAGAADRTPAIGAVRRVLRELGKGKEAFEFVTVPELLERGRPVCRPWFVRSEEEW